MREKMVMPHLGILVTTYCNLNCRNCADLIPKRERKHYKIEEIKNDLLKILEVVEFIEEVLVIGGETLLYPDLNEVLDFCMKQPKIGKIIITTNGRMMPNDELLDCFRRNKVLVRISGYPEHVVPNRNEVLKKYKDNAVEIEDLEHMTWLSVGDAHKRGRTPEELQKVFKTCSMRYCVTINCEGKIYYCSRQLSANELSNYPNPKENEYVDVRNAKNLEESLRAFYELSYISTCDYCDGISCATTQIVPTATQILNKDVFLEAIGGYETLLDGNASTAEKGEAIKMIYHIVDEYMMYLYDFKETSELIKALERFTNGNSENSYDLFVESYKNFLNVLTSDYTFSVSTNVPYGLKNNIKNRPNCIKTGMYPMDTEADIMLTENDIIKALNEKYPMDGLVYNKLFIESKLKRLKTERIISVVSGLSYTQYGILEEKMPHPTVNLSVTGEDTPYSVLMAEYALNINSGVKNVILPMTYYQGCYDMSNDEIELHKEVVSRVNIPILNNARNFTGIVKGENGYYVGQPLKIYENVLDLNAACVWREEMIKDRLTRMEYFNEMNPQSSCGGLKFNFRDLATREEKMASAKITAEHNERVCTKAGYDEVKRYLEHFLDTMKKMEKKVLIFVPPMTEYLYEGYHEKLKDFYYEKIVTLLGCYENVMFVDLAADKRFSETDFCDFEHLNRNGAEKLTQIIGALISVSEKENETINTEAGGI